MPRLRTQSSPMVKPSLLFHFMSRTISVDIIPVELRLRDPNGGVYSSGFYGGGLYFQGDPKVFRKYTETVVLPKGSIPGIWGLQEMLVIDKAGNRITHDFTEIVRFEVGEEPAAPSLIADLPQTTQLWANYPNPFNPETWIPYQLAKETKVTLQIYSVNGALIRTLTLGHQPAGIYQTRSRAAYWNGRNEWGEPVASGVYFLYTQNWRFHSNAEAIDSEVG